MQKKSIEDFKKKTYSNPIVAEIMGRRQMLKKSITDFKAKTYGKPIVAEGRWEVGYAADHLAANINVSSIATKLIQEAGRWCTSFASDFLVQWIPIANGLEDGTLRSKRKIFGFRESGVDHEGFLLNRYTTYSDSVTAAYYYRSIWRLDIDCETNENGEVFPGAAIKFTLYECDR